MTSEYYAKRVPTEPVGTTDIVVLHALCRIADSAERDADYPSAGGVGLARYAHDPDSRHPLNPMGGYSNGRAAQ